jgi:hypothetical protein
VHGSEGTKKGVSDVSIRNVEHGTK